MAKQIESLDVKAHGKQGCSALFTLKGEPGARFHVWLKEDGSGLAPDLGGRPGVIYKNPLLGVERHGPGYFDTRELDPNKRANAALIADILQRVRDGDLIAKARQGEADAAEAEAAEEFWARCDGTQRALKAAVERLEETHPLAALHLRQAVSGLPDDALDRIADLFNPPIQGG